MATQILSPAHEAAFDEQNGLLIKALDDEDASVALTREEVVALRVLITPPVTNEGVDKLLDGINEKACDWDWTRYGLPLNRKDIAVRESFRQIVRGWLAAHNQPIAPSQSGDGAKEQQ